MSLQRCELFTPYELYVFFEPAWNAFTLIPTFAYRDKRNASKDNKQLQEAQLSPSDRAMRLVSSNLASYHATVQKLLISPVYRRLDVAKLSKSTM